VAGGRVEVVLVFGGFLGFRLDVELALEPDLFLVLDRLGQEAAEMIEFAFHIGVEQGVVAFAAAPEHIPGAAELLRDLKGLLHLARGIGINFGRRIRRGSGHEPPVRKEIARAPQKLDAGLPLEFLRQRGNRLDVLVAFGEGRALRRDIVIVEAPEPHAEFREELKRGVHRRFGLRHRARGFIVLAEHGARTKRIAARAFERVPIAHREPEVFSHGFAENSLFGVVVLEREGLLRFRAFVRNRRADLGEILGHRFLLPSAGRPARRDNFAHVSRQLSTCTREGETWRNPGRAEARASLL